MPGQNSSLRPLRVAVIGSGPAGLYAAEALAGRHDVAVSVDVFDRLPTPYGLVRYGVAPDHQKIKSVTAAFQRILEHPRVRFLGHVEYGRDLSHDDLRRHYDAVIYAVGAAADRPLGIPGEDLPGSLSATEFVAWYNGHPDGMSQAPPLAAHGVAVIGMGNVALDVTRILAHRVDDLRPTDIADQALDALARSAVADIYILGRRGPAQATFTPKELKELGELAAADIVVRTEEVMLGPREEALLDPSARRNLEVLRAFARTPPRGRPRRIHLRFRVAPVEIAGPGRVQSLCLERTRLDEEGRAVGTGTYDRLAVQLVLRAVGYRGRPLAGVPFDARTGTIPNEGGRVLRDGAVARGEYVTGWARRGPRGVIGTNKACAAETVAHLLHDAPDLLGAPAPDPADVVTLLEERKVAYVTLEQWLRLDRYEQEVGAARGRARVKVISRAAMLQVVLGPIHGDRRTASTVDAEATTAQARSA